MAEPGKIFRDKALVKLASPEELDKMIQVTDLKGWLALIGLVGLLTAALAWSILGSIPVVTRGNGLLVRQDGIREIKATTAGQVSELIIKAGDTLKEGQLIGKAKSASGQETELRSPYSGVVLEVLVEKDSSLQPQTMIASLEQINQPLQAIIFVPLAEGKQLRPGLKVQLSPATVRVEEYGYLLGTVSSVSQFPVSAESLLLTLKSRELAQTVSANGPVVRVDVEIEHAPGNMNSFKWTSSSQPPLMLTSSTPTTANLILSEQRPISLLLPFLKASES